MRNEEQLSKGKPDQHMIPLGDYVIIQKGEECDKVTKSGFILSNPKPDEKEFGILESIGPSCEIVTKDLVGKLVVTFRVGPEMKYEKDGKIYFICKEDSVIAYY